MSVKASCNKHLSFPCFCFLLLCILSSDYLGWQAKLVSVGTISSRIQGYGTLGAWLYLSCRTALLNLSSPFKQSLPVLISASSFLFFFSLSISKQCSLSGYEDTALKTSRSLAFLNFGQNVIFSTALSTAMVLCSHGIMNGQMTVGDLVKLLHKRRNYHKALYLVLTDG